MAKNTDTQNSYPTGSSEKSESSESGAASFFNKEFMQPYELAEVLGISTRSLARWHAIGRGPPRIRVHNLIFYRQSAVRDWLIEAEVAPVRNLTRR